MKVAHLMSVHPRFDTRIFIKQCSSLSLHGFDVFLVVADGGGNEIKNGVKIVDVGPSEAGRLSRVTKTVRSVYKKAIEIDADIYHLHDPELIPIGRYLKKHGKKIVFDAHEDLPKQLLSKQYLNKPVGKSLSKLLAFYESRALPKFDALVAATPYIRDKFLKINPNTADINNFPILAEIENTNNWKQKQNEAVYIGGLTKTRGIEEIVVAMSYTQGVQLNLGGKFNERTIEDRVKNNPAWSKVNELGFLNRKEVQAALARSKVGLVMLHPIINYLDSLPVKMFEYMAAGIPSIASNFSLWQEILEGNRCGICLDPFDARAIGEAIQHLIDNPAEAAQMGRNGRRAVEEKYNWAREEAKLIALYRDIERRL